MFRYTVLSIRTLTEPNVDAFILLLSAPPRKTLKAMIVNKEMRTQFLMSVLLVVLRRKMDGLVGLESRCLDVCRMQTYVKKRTDSTTFLAISLNG